MQCLRCGRSNGGLKRARQNIDRLVRQGLLERNEDLEDRRAKRITLTHAEEVTSTLSEAQRVQIRDVLVLLTEAASALKALHPGDGK